MYGGKLLESCSVIHHCAAWNGVNSIIIAEMTFHLSQKRQREWEEKAAIIKEKMNQRITMIALVKTFTK